jgi:hypothetical protein
LTARGSAGGRAECGAGHRPGRSEPWKKAGALALVLAALGLPVNDLFHYALLVIAAVAILLGTLSRHRLVWLAAAAAVGVCVLGQLFLAAPRIEEGHNLFLIDAPGGALEAGLPPSAFQIMAAQFNARYPPEHRCPAAVDGCWRGGAFPPQNYAFSSDGLYDRPAFSRRVTGIDFSDPIWLRLGFINEGGYNWNSRVSDVDRASRDGRISALLHRWRLEMPWFVMYRFPAELVGSSLCWRGDVLWEGPQDHFELATHSSMQCRTIAPADVGRRIFGVAIRQGSPLAMRLEPSRSVALAQFVEPVLSLVGVAAVLGLLVRVRARRLIVAYALIAVTFLVVALNDASFIGGVRPFDSGDDGLVYEGLAREMLRNLAGGNISGALEGGEKVFYFTPGMRYLRMLEHCIFGDTFLGYLSLILLLPFLVLALFRRFLPVEWALALTAIFVAIPLGVLFGSSLVQYAKWAARGFADPAAYIFFLSGLVVLVGNSPQGPRPAFGAACAAGFLFALALFVRPNIAPAAAVLLAGSSIAALCKAQYRRIIGFVVGFLPVLGMALHNWIYGGAFVLFTSTAAHPGALVTPPSVYLAALGELLRLHVAGEHVARVARQIGGWLAGPSESYLMAPLDAAALVVLIRVALWKEMDPWLRLTAWATLAQQCVGMFYAPAGRYYYLTWLLTLLITAVWVQREGLALFQRRCPRIATRIAAYPAWRALARMLLTIAGWLRPACDPIPAGCRHP